MIKLLFLKNFEFVGFGYMGLKRISGVSGGGFWNLDVMILRIFRILFWGEVVVFRLRGYWDECVWLLLFKCGNV